MDVFEGDTLEDHDDRFLVAGYLFEPEFTDEELRDREALRIENQERLADPDYPQMTRMEGTWWCSCGECSVMSTEDECLCCRDWLLGDATLHEMEMMSTEEEDSDICLTSHPDFQPHLHPAILSTFFRMPKVNWKKNSTPAGPNGDLSNEQYRLVAYRLTMEWVLRGERLGRGERRVIPSCIVKAIRNKFPSPFYVGFKDIEDVYELLE